MSVFGDGSYKEEVYSNLHWIMNGVEPVEDEYKQLVYLHETMMNLISGKHEKVHELIIKWGKEDGLTYKQMAAELSYVYHVMIERWKE